MVRRKRRLTGYRKWEKEAIRQSKTVQIGESLQQLIDHLEIGDLLSQQRALFVWSSVVGKAISAKTEPKTIKDGILRVEVSDSTWRQELIYLKSDIIEKLNSELSETVVKDIKFR